MNHRSRWLQESRLADMVPGLLALHREGDVVAQCFVAFAGAHPAVEVVLNLGEQAGSNLAIGGEPHAAAGAAKSLGNRSDDPDLAAPIGKAIASRCLAGLTRRQRS